MQISLSLACQHLGMSHAALTKKKRQSEAKKKNTNVSILVSNYCASLLSFMAPKKFFFIIISSNTRSYTYVYIIYIKQTPFKNLSRHLFFSWEFYVLFRRFVGNFFPSFFQSLLTVKWFDNFIGRVPNVCLCNLLWLSQLYWIKLFALSFVCCCSSLDV